MDVKNLADELKNKAGEVENLMRRKLPVIVGRMAKDHYQDNFRKGGFVNRGLQQWPVTRRQSLGIPGAEGAYGPLLSRRNHLFSSLKYIPTDFRVTVSNDLPYASIHNWGGVVNPTVTPRMRRFAWAMYYNAQGLRNKPIRGKKGGKKRPSVKRTESAQQNFWKAMALTKKIRLNIQIPQRQFIGESEELNQRIQSRIENELSKTLEL